MSMDIENVIKSVIQIDKGATGLKDSVQSQIKKKKAYIDAQVEQMHESIVNERKEAAKLKAQKLIDETTEQANKEKEKANEQAKKMEEAYMRRRSELVEDVFKSLFLEQ